MWDPVSNKVIQTSSVKFANALLHPIVAPDDADIDTPSLSTSSLSLSPPLTSTTMTSQPSPPSSPPSETPLELNSQVLQSGGEDEDTLLQQLDEIQLPELGQGHHFEGFSVEPREAPCHLDISSTLDSHLIVNTKRACRPTAKAAAVTILNNLTPLALACCFASAIAEALTIYHSNSANLPPEPTSHKKAMQHVFATGWMTAV
jgi:hypothetical protein